MKSGSLKAFPLILAIGTGIAFGAGAAAAATTAMPTGATSNPMMAKSYTGKIVYTQGGSEIGKVKDIVHSDKDDGNYAVITLGGGQLDSEPRQVVVPADQISFTQDSVMLSWDASKELVRSMPIYKTNTATRVTE